MTIEEANVVAEIISHADSGCSVCVSDLVERCNDGFPEFLWLYEEDYGPVEVKVREPVA